MKFNKQDFIAHVAILSAFGSLALSGGALSSNLNAQTTPTPAAKFVDSARVEIDAASAANDNDRLAQVVVLLDRALTAFPKDPYVLHYRGYANYRRVTSLMQAGKIPAAEPLLSSSIADLQQSSDKLRWAETYVLLGALQAFRVSINPDLGRELGPEMSALTAQAVQLAPNNPRVLLMQAYGMYHTPPEYGGDVQKARDFVARAIKAFETDKPAPLAPAWGKAEAVALQKRIAGGQ
jgi:hypothetical protein